MLILLSLKAGLRAAEISNLTWDMVQTPAGELSHIIELRDTAAKMGHGRINPIQSELRNALLAWRQVSLTRSGPVVLSERGSKMTALGIVVWFREHFSKLGGSIT